MQVVDATEPVYCHYCDCQDCKEGTPYLSRAQVVNGAGWCCDVCWYYKFCIDAGANEPCRDKNCPHRPVLCSKWFARKRREPADNETSDQEDM